MQPANLEALAGRDPLREDDGEGRKGQRLVRDAEDVAGREALRHQNLPKNSRLELGGDFVKSSAKLLLVFGFIWRCEAKRRGGGGCLPPPASL